MLLTLMGNNWMFQTERSGWWRLWLAAETQKHIDAKRKPKVEDKVEVPHVTKMVKQPRRKLPKVERIRKPIPDTPTVSYKPIIPVARPIEPSMYERIGMLHFTTYSTSVYTSSIRHTNVVDLDAQRKKRRKKQDEEVLLLLAA